jgi:hypothetical protein
VPGKEGGGFFLFLFLFLFVFLHLSQPEHQTLMVIRRDKTIPLAPFSYQRTRALEMLSRRPLLIAR